MRLALALAVPACIACLAGAGSASAGPYSGLLAPAGACGAAADQLSLQPAVAEAAMLCLTNWARAQSGLQPLTASTTLDAAGDAKVAADITCGEFTHTPCGHPFTDVFATYVAGATGYALGENIAWGTGDFGTPRGTMDGWLNSDGHRANILDARFTDLGIGYLPNQTFLGYGGATLWSQEFGARSVPATTAKPPAKKPKPAKKKHRR